MSRNWRILGEADTGMPLVYRDALGGGVVLMRVMGAEGNQTVVLSSRQLAELHPLTTVPCQDTNCACFQAGVLWARENPDG